MMEGFAQECTPSFKIFLSGSDGTKIARDFVSFESLSEHNLCENEMILFDTARNSTLVVLVCTFSHLFFTTFPLSKQSSLQPMQ